MVRRTRTRGKHIRIDRAKLGKAKRLLDVATDAKALDRALTFVESEGNLDETLLRIGGKAGLKKVFR